MNVDSAHKNHWVIAEVVFGIPFLLGVLMHFVVPFSFPQMPGIFSQILIPVGIIILIVGIGIIVLARREFAHYGQPTDPGHPTSKVVKTGVFTISRNPLYLGSVLVFLGIALIFNLLWTIITLLISIVISHYALIIPEEQYLAAKFGDEYREYFASVHRWLGRK